MKIEMGESLIYSWLRHIKKCQIVELNWKISDEWGYKTKDDFKKVIDNLENLMKEIQDRFDKPFKEVYKLSQLIKFSEGDVIGFDFNNKNLYCVDIAFHSHGLGYSDNVKRVTKKILRTSLILDLYFNDAYNKNVIFCTPKVNPQTYEMLMERERELKSFINKSNLKTSIKIISNEKFKDQILNPILSLSDNVANTSELFLRSYQLTQLFKKRETVKSTSKTFYQKNLSNSEVNKIKIGKFVQTTFHRLFDESRLKSSDIKELINLEYCKKIFKMSSYPVLIATDSIKDYNKKRYYKKTYEGKYLLCSQWYEKQRNPFKQWLNTKGYHS